MAKCGAKTRQGGKCKRNAMPNGRCKLHGGASTGAPIGNRNAVRWGFFSKHIDAEQLAIMQEFDTYEPVDMLWQNILIAYSAIVRAQKLMFVRDQEDIVKNIKRERQSENATEYEVEFQYPWDRHANFMQAQARGQSELRSLIKDFLAIADETDVRRLKIQAMQKEIEIKSLEAEKLRGIAPDEYEDDGFLEALKGRGSEVWMNELNDGEGNDASDTEET